MPDIRINALTEASASVTTDFLPIDGNTGTRKLSAYSPSFGGNATVGGTLTVSGTGDSAVSGNLTIPADKGFYLKQGNVAKWTSDGSSTGTSRGDIYCDSGGAMFIRTGGTSTAISISSSQVVSVAGTLASTTTSSGALVVGNGTSGGLGVGGNAYIGGDLVVASHTKGIYSQGYVAVKGYQANLFSRGTPLGWTAGLHFYTSGNDYSATIVHYPDTGDLQFFTNATSSNYAASDEALRITTAKQVQVKATTASTSTSSGALVVSGGVGVAGAIYAGARIQSAVDLVVDAGSGSANAALYLAGRNSGTQNLVTIQSNFEGALTITPKAGQGTTIASSLTTAAPSGGTAAAWKLGAVATVSPTSPNRTIEVDIGGTIYYIHAKTTNN